MTFDRLGVAQETGPVATPGPVSCVDSEMRRPPRADSAAYMRWYRARNPRKTHRERVVRAARLRAVARLAARYPEELRVLYDEELRRAGL